ncbi:hypothetical protein JB92DRAFT_3138310 [Gautieria morchelliformis]|nr:hypothetical protein JB92DRAFT_3138310 [Gautieria morchelliformis]
MLLHLHCYVTAETCLDPIHSQMDIAVTMASRDARPPFNVRLTPPLTRSPKDLWRLDTSEKYVRGEEVLSTFRPRGISVVEDYLRLVSTEQRAADVQAIKVVLAAAPPPPPSDWLDSDQILHESLALWQKQFGDQGKLCWHSIVYVPSDTDLSAQSNSQFEPSVVSDPLAQIMPGDAGENVLQRPKELQCADPDSSSAVPPDVTAFAHRDASLPSVLSRRIYAPHLRPLRAIAGPGEICCSVEVEGKICPQLHWTTDLSRSPEGLPGAVPPSPSNAQMRTHLGYQVSPHFDLP